MTTLTPADTQAARATPCPRCGAAVGHDQDWCLQCGAAARTRIAPTPSWRAPVAALAALALAAGVAIAIAFASLTGNDNATPTTSTAAPAATTPPPAATTPPPATPTPGTSTPAP